jgi:tRNA pseudouridine13 synthase
MKLKENPEDFHVEELTDVQPALDGPFAFYRMEKKGWSTSDALAIVRRRWKIEPRRISYGGLKDRHASTIQHLTMFHGPRRNFNQQDIHLRFLGHLARAFTHLDIQRNRFAVTLRNIPPQQKPNFDDPLLSLAAQGVPNYFDDQRFGSIQTPADEFVARHLVLGRFEDALRLALTGPYPFDRAAQKKEKKFWQDHWGDWSLCKTLLPKSPDRRILDYLARHPADFRGAFVKVRPELRGLYLSAYQSHLWNRILARWLRQSIHNDCLSMVKLRGGPLPFHEHLDDTQFQNLVGLQLPLPTARWRPEPADPRGDLVRAELAEEGLELTKLKVQGVRELFFSKGDRAALCLPENFRSEWGDDERHHGKSRLTLRFDLPRGSYATLIVKALQSGLPPQRSRLYP